MGVNCGVFSVGGYWMAGTEGRACGSGDAGSGTQQTATANLPFAASAGMWDGSDLSWAVGSPTGNLPVAEGFGRAASLANGDVLIAGGRSASGPTATAQVYEPNMAAAPRLSRASPPST